MICRSKFNKMISKEKKKNDRHKNRPKSKQSYTMFMVRRYHTIKEVPKKIIIIIKLKKLEIGRNTQKERRGL